MQILIEIPKEQDLQVLLPLLERLKIDYKALPNDVLLQEKPIQKGKISGKYRGKLSKQVGKDLQKHIAKSRLEWERNI
jgi:hypothetical protein